MLLDKKNESLLYQKLTEQQKVLEEILLEILLRKHEIVKNNKEAPASGE